MAQKNNSNTTIPSLPTVTVDTKGMHLSLPSFKTSPKWDKDAQVIYHGYSVEVSEVISAGAKNSNLSATLAGKVQSIIYADAINGMSATLTALSTGEEDETEEARKVRVLTLSSLQSALKQAREACPYSKEVTEDFRQKNPHAVFLACIVDGQPLPVKWVTWFENVVKCETVLDTILKTVMQDGKATLSEEQRATLTACKTAVKAMFSAYTGKTNDNRAFDLRVLDDDIIQWYKMSASGYTRKGTLKRTLTPKDAEKSPLCRSITAWFFGKIRKEYTES